MFGTSQAAAYLNLANLGTVASGHIADFLVLDANPLNDILNTRRVSRLYIQGTEVDRPALRAHLTGAAASIN